MTSNVRGPWWATVVLFLVHGLVVATWISRIPAIQTALHLSNFVFGLALLSSALGALVSIPIAGILVGRFGSKLVCIVLGIAFSLSSVLMALAVNAVTLALALFVFGGLAASMDVGMNLQGVEVEKAQQKPSMSRFHGMFSLGAMIGAAAGGTVATHGIGTIPHFATSALLNALGVLSISGLLLDIHDPAKSTDHRLPISKMPRVLLALSGIGFCILLAEGAMADWTALYLKQVLHAGQGTAAAGYSVFSATMAIMRLLGDMVTAKLGPMRAVRTGALVGAAGLAWALSMQDATWALPGFGIVGCGFSVIIPLVFGSGGRVKGIAPGAGIASVTGIGYLGFIIGPPLIGFLSQSMTLRGALLVVLVCCLVSAYLTREMRSLDAAPPSMTEPDGLSVTGHL